MWTYYISCAQKRGNKLNISANLYLIFSSVQRSFSSFSQALRPSLHCFRSACLYPLHFLEYFLWTIRCPCRLTFSRHLETQLILISAFVILKIGNRIQSR